MTATTLKEPRHAGAENAPAAALNGVLKYALTAINQYFLHARMLKHMGELKLADQTYKASIDSMHRADRLVERILAVGGTPNLQELGRLHIGGTAPEILACNLRLEQEAAAEADRALNHCRAAGDETSTTLLERISQGMGQHIHFLQEQQESLSSQLEKA